jgi:glyoxylase I family protein
VKVDDKIDDESNGRFGWAMHPEGNRIELWEPKRERRDRAISMRR